jgi:DNA-binding CsgD family transcriptional regulator
MRSQKQSIQHASNSKNFAVRPKVFIFLDKKSGTRRFEVKAAPDGRIPVDHAVDLLAVHCLVRQQSPSDFMVMVGTNQDLIESLGARARKIIRACLLDTGSVHLSHRQQEVLRAILQGLTNKEIASKLNISERTIKFHVSLLLQKFGVENRLGLMRKANDFLVARLAAGSEDARSLPGRETSAAPLSARPHHSPAPPRPQSMPFRLIARRSGA